MKTLQLHANRVSRSTLVVMAAQAVVLLASPTSARRAANSNAGESLRVDYDGIYLVQREGQCLSGGPCDLGGQCPGSEFVTGRYPNVPLYCGPPTLLARLPGLLRIARRQRSPGSRRPPPSRRARAELLAKAMAGHSRPPSPRAIPSQSLPRPWRAGHRSSHALPALGQAAPAEMKRPLSRHQTKGRPDRPPCPARASLNSRASGGGGGDDGGDGGTVAASCGAIRCGDGGGGDDGDIAPPARRRPLLLPGSAATLPRSR